MGTVLHSTLEDARCVSQASAVVYDNKQQLQEQGNQAEAEFTRIMNLLEQPPMPLAPPCGWTTPRHNRHTASSPSRVGSTGSVPSTPLSWSVPNLQSSPIKSAAFSSVQGMQSSTSRMDPATCGPPYTSYTLPAARKV